MDAGKLNRFMKICAYEDGQWAEKRSIYAAYKHSDRAIYSKYAQAVDGAVVTIRRINIDRHMAISYCGSHYLITDIDDTERGLLTLQLARVRLRLIGVKRMTATMDALNRPIDTESEPYAPFQAVISDAYERWQRERPNFELSGGRILTTPKCIELLAGDIVFCQDCKYAVRASRTENEFINDYEIERLDDA